MISLMIGRPYGHWRSSLNYACVPMGAIMHAFDKVQSVLLGIEPQNSKLAYTAAFSTPVGAGVLCNRMIGRPGLPTLSGIALLPGSTRSDEINVIAAKADRLKRLLGCRYSNGLPNPSDEYISAAGLFVFQDKNLRGKVFPRPVPVPEAMETFLKDGEWGKLPKQLHVPARNTARINRIRIAGEDPNAGRKSFYSTLLTKDVGDEAVSAIFGHGLALTKGFGPISPLPALWFLDELSSEINKVFREQGIDESIRALPKPSRRQAIKVRSQKKSTEPEIQIDKTAEAEQLDVAVQHLPIPSAKEFEFLKALHEAILKKWRDYRNSPEEFKKLVILSLALYAVPLNRLLRLRKYFRGSSLVRSRHNGHFLHHVIVPLPQQDLGLGLVPLLLSERSGKLLHVFFRILMLRQLRIYRAKYPNASDAAKRGHCKKFDSRLIFPSLNRTEFDETMRFADRLVATNRKRRGTEWIRATLTKGSRFFCRSRFGALIFNSLTGASITPPNFVSIPDILFQAAGTPLTIKTVSGQCWTNPFIHSGNSERRLKSYKRLQENKKVGRPSSAIVPCKGQSTIDELVAYFAATSRYPKPADIKRWFLQSKVAIPYKHLAGSGHCTEKEASYSARIIFRELLAKGLLVTGTPEHLLWPDKTIRFLEIFSEVVLQDRLLRSQPQAARWWATIILLIGCRPNEAPLIQTQHVDNIKTPLIIRIVGTKTDAAPRTIDLSLFTSFKTGRTLRTKLMEIENDGWPLGKDVKFPVDDVHFQNRVNTCLNSAYSKLRTELGLPAAEGVFTLNSLRHACAFRVIQTAVTQNLWNGTLWIGIASVSQALGHRSIVTTWCSYLGTAMLSLRWPSRRSPKASHCPLLNPLRNFIERQC